MAPKGAACGSKPKGWENERWANRCTIMQNTHNQNGTAGTRFHSTSGVEGIHSSWGPGRRANGTQPGRRSPPGRFGRAADDHINPFDPHNNLVSLLPWRLQWGSRDTGQSLPVALTKDTSMREAWMGHVRLCGPQSRPNHPAGMAESENAAA